MQTHVPKILPYSERIKLFIERKGITMYRLAVDAGLSPQAVSHTLRNGGELKTTTLAAIAQAFPDLNLRWLLTGEGDMLVGAGEGGAGRGAIQTDGGSTLEDDALKTKKMLEIDMPYTLYSMKHAGATLLHSAGASLSYIRDQCRHANIATTDRYLRQLGGGNRRYSEFDF